jgi:hypothetical protein
MWWKLARGLDWTVHVDHMILAQDIIAQSCDTLVPIGSNVIPDDSKGPYGAGHRN